ncbi:MAG: anaerobic sulfite reductase subunit AsrB [Victivallaceae bacterium]|nr:anaerobic sulfite reductase subunit AsrB [Victivallaceae bacterium]
MCNNPLKPEPYKITNIIRDTEFEWTFAIDFSGEIKAGQFFQVSLPRVGEMPISVSNMRGGLEMTIRKTGKVSGYVFDLEAGDNIFLRGPYGTSFPIDDYKGKHLVIMAGGSGSAPVRPIIEHFYYNSDEITSMDIILGFRIPDLILFKDDIKKWSKKFNTVLTVDNPDDSWTGKVGLGTKYVGDIDFSDAENMAVVIVGPPVMIGFCVREFTSRNVKNEQITVSMERRMACGIGKCGRCKINDKYICQDGPIFRYDEAVNLID